jgi:hypothetical protein
MLAKSATQYFRNHIRGGGKESRRKEVSRIIEFLDWVESTERVISLHGLGKRHVIGFWKTRRGLSDQTLYKYWLGISKLWKWLDKQEKPPKPFYSEILESINESSSEIDQTINPPVNKKFKTFGLCMKYALKKKDISLNELSRMTDLDIEKLNGYIGEEYQKFNEMHVIMSVLGIYYCFVVD